MSKNCWLPYYQAEISQDLKPKPCCKYKGDWINSLENYINVDRSEFDGVTLPLNCKVCEVDNSYKEIKKIHFKQRGLSEPIEPKLLSLTLYLDNVCSNSCLMCNSGNSTTIGYLLGNHFKNSFDLDTLDSNIHSLKWITIYGGEPLQSPNLIKLCDKLKISNVQHLNILTSLANPVKANLMALESLHIPINFRISIDGEQSLNEWIRGYNKKDWLSTFKIIQNLGTYNWQVTVGNYNIFALPECLDYLEILAPKRDVLPSIVNWPEECSAKELPFEIKEQINNKLLNYRSLPNNRHIINTALEQLNQNQNLDFDQCKNYINKLPKLRGSSKDFDFWLQHYLPV